jgi:hypothetical protein
MPKNDVQARSNQIVHTLQSAATQLEAVLKLYQSQVRLGQRKEDPLKLLQQLHGVGIVLQKIRWEVLLQELTRVLHNGDLPEAVRNEKVGKIFKSLA